MSQVAPSPTVTKPPRASGASSFDIILERCHDLISERVADALARMFDEADEALTAFGSLSRDPETSKLYEVTRKKIRSQREAIVTRFRMHFFREFQERANRVKKIGDQFADIDVSSLEPAGEDDPNESRKFDAMASRLRQYCEEELLALDQRVGVLVGDADLQSDDNPFIPQAIIDAYKHTCRQTDSNVDVRMVLLKLFDDYVLDEIRGMYKAVNALLIKNSILPKIRFSVERASFAAKAPAVEQKPEKVSAAPVTEKVQPEVRQTERRGTNRMDAMTLDIMAMLFDELFDDRDVPTTVKALINRLQTPMLKLVIADKSFFSRKSHPARQMLDKLSELAAALPSDIGVSDPVYGKLESIIQSLIEGFRDDIRAFDALHQEVDALIKEVKERPEKETQSKPGRVDEEQKLALAKTAAQTEIKARLRGSAAPQPIVDFLTTHWAKLLVVTYLREGEKSEAWENALKTVDLLLWTGEKVEADEERRKVIASLPTLLKSFYDGLASTGIDDAVRAQLFAHLRKSHAAIFSRPTQSKAATPGKEDVIGKEAAVEKESAVEQEATIEKEAAFEKESVSKQAYKEAVSSLGFGLLDYVDKTKASDTFPAYEAAKVLVRPDAAQASDAAEESDSLSTRDEPAEADNGKEVRLDYLPSMNDADEIPELTDEVTAKAATPAEKPRTPAAPSATPEQDSALDFTRSTSRAYEAPSAKLRAEMDKVMDATRTMFSDIDRFIMLGQYQNAISVLDSRIKHEPDDRGSWITLMAIYRDEDMKDDFYRTYAKFRKHFGEKPDA